MRGTVWIRTVAVALVIVRSGEWQSPQRFEVASVRISPAGGSGMTSWNAPGGTAFIATNIPLHFGTSTLID
jgi:hypothetical protein